MTTDEAKISAKQEKLIAALMVTATVQAAAKTAGVSETTAHRWLREDANFDTAYRAARKNAVGQAIARLQQTSGAAVQVLLTIALDKAAPTSSRVAAASKVLDMAIKAVELESLEDRLRALEQQYVQHYQEAP